MTNRIKYKVVQILSGQIYGFYATKRDAMAQKNQLEEEMNTPFKIVEL